MPALRRDPDEDGGDSPTDPLYKQQLFEFIEREELFGSFFKPFKPFKSVVGFLRRWT